MTDVTQVATVSRKIGRPALTEEEKLQRKEQNKEHKKIGRPALTEEEKQQRKEQNKEYMRERYKTVYAPLRDRTIKVMCECGSEVSYSNMYRHKRSRKHLCKIQSNIKLESDD